MQPQPSIEQLQEALVNAHNAGDTYAANRLADEIGRVRATQNPLPPLAAGQQAQFDRFLTQQTADSAPSAGGSFGREAARSVVPGLAGFASGAGTGAALGAAGMNPITVGIGALGGGLLGAFGVRFGQDKLADAVAPDSMFGTASAARDFETNPISTLLGGAVAQGRPSLSAVRTAGNIATKEGRALLAQGLRAEATPAARAAFTDAVDSGAGAAVGAGMSLATGDGMAGENALLGAIFSKPWIGPRLRPHGQPDAAGEPAPTSTEIIPAPDRVERGPVTRIGNGESALGPAEGPIGWFAPRGLPMGDAPANLPAPEPARVASDPIPRLPEGDPSARQSPPVTSANRETQINQSVDSLETDLVNLRIRRELMAERFKEKGLPANYGAGKRAFQLIDKEIRLTEDRIGRLRSGEVQFPEPVREQPIREVDNRPLGADPRQRISLPPLSDEPNPQRQPAPSPEVETPPMQVRPLPERAAAPEASPATGGDERPVRDGGEPPSTADAVVPRAEPTAPDVDAAMGEWRSLEGQHVSLANRLWDMRNGKAGRVSQKAVREMAAEVDRVKTQMNEAKARYYEAKKAATAPEKPAPAKAAPQTAAEPLTPKQAGIAKGHLKNARAQLERMQAAGKDGEQTAKVRARIAKLEEQLGESQVGPEMTDQLETVFTVRDGDYPTIAAIRDAGGIRPPADRITAGVRDADASWNDAPDRTAFNDGTPGGNLAGRAFDSLIARGNESAQTADQMAAQLGFDSATEMWAKAGGELEEVRRNNGPRPKQDEQDFSVPERQLMAFEEALDSQPDFAKDEVGYLNKGDRFEIDGEPVKVTNVTEDTVTLRDGDRFGTQTVPRDAMIPVENLDPAAKGDVATPSAGEDLALKAHESDADIRADKRRLAEQRAASKAKGDMMEQRNAKLTGDMGDTTADLFVDPIDNPDIPLFLHKPTKAEGGHPEGKSAIDALKDHRANVEKWLKQNRGKTYMAIPGLDPQTAGTIYKLALDTVIKSVEGGMAARKAIGDAIAAVTKRFKNLKKNQLAAIKARLAADVRDHLHFAGQRDADLKVELNRIAQEFAVAGKDKPTNAELAKALADRRPDHADYVRKNIDRMVAEMIIDSDRLKAAPANESSRAWAEWVEGVRSTAKDLASGARSGTPERTAWQTVRSIHDMLFTGIGNRFHNLASGSYTGRRSDALQKWVDGVFGVKVGKDGVQRVGADLGAERDHNVRLNPLDDFTQETEKWMRDKSMTKAERDAWRARVVEHMVDPSRDSELASQPELKKAVDFFLKRRRERLELMRSNNVEVGDAGERSASRMMDPAKVATNRKDFIKQASEAYRQKWDREIRALKDKAEEYRLRDEEGDYERYEKTMEKVAEIERRDAGLYAEAYFDAILAGDRGLSSNGNDIFGGRDGNKSDMTKSREFGAEADELLGKFMFRDAFMQDAYETTAAVREVTRARMLADKNPNGTIDPVGQWKKLRKALEDEGNGDMVPLAKELVMNYLNVRGIDNPIAQKAMETTHTITQLAYLSRAGVSNLGEPVLIGLRTGSVKQMLNAYRVAGRNLYRRLRNLDPTESQIIAGGLGVAKGGLNSVMGGIRLQDPFGGRGLQGKIVSSFHVKTLLTDITAAMHEAGVEIGRSYLHTQLRLVANKGSLRNIALKNLNELGISSADAKDMLRFMDKLEKSENPRAEIFGDSAEAKKLRDALVLFNRSGAVLDPTRGSRAQFANSPVGSLFYSLQSFLYEFHQKVVMRHWTRAKAAAKGGMEIEGEWKELTGRERTEIGKELLAGASAIYAAQFGVQLIREFLFSDPERIAKDKRRTDAEIWQGRMNATLSRTGVFGPYDLVFNMFAQARFQREPATVVLGPAVGGVSELFQAFVTASNAERNSPNTNTAERKLARSIYNMTIAPALGATFATMPGRFIPGVLTQNAYHPMNREVFVEGVAGPPMKPGGSAPAGPMRVRVKD